MRLIALHGQMGSGKTTVSNMILNKTQGKIVKFAGPLYAIQQYVYETTGLTLKGEKDRKLLQFIGTDWGRTIDANIWTNIFKATVKTTPESILCVCDDVRFENELDVIKELNGYSIKIKRDNYDKPVNGGSINHVSEAGLDDSLFDLVIENNGDLKSLENEINLVLENLKCGKI